MRELKVSTSKHPVGRGAPGPSRRSSVIAGTSGISAQLAAVFESSQDAVLGKSLDGIVKIWNPAAEKLFGYQAKEILGTTASGLLPVDCPGQNVDCSGEDKDWLARIRRGERVEPCETVWRRKDGSRVSIFMSVSPILDSRNSVIGASFFLRDMTAPRELDLRRAEMQRLESLGILAGGIAHDFDNLLTGILGNANLAMQRLPRTSAVRALLGDVVKASETAAKLTRQLLAYAGNETTRSEQICLSELVRDTVHLIGTSIPAKVQLTLELDASLPRIEGDAGQLQQVIMNLIINGAEAICQKSGTVRVRTWQQEADRNYLGSFFQETNLLPGTYVAMEIEDSGCGMDEGTRARMFDPFFTTKMTGKGLGLAAVTGIIRSHGGALKVDSAPGRGSTFLVVFAAGDEQMDIQSERPEEEQLGGCGGILVVENDEAVCDFTRKTLEYYGYTVTSANSGAEGLRLFRQSPDSFRLIILDIAMPGMSGEEFFRKLRLTNPGVPVLLASGFSEKIAESCFRGEKIGGFIQKPYSIRQLAEQVRTAIMP